MIKWKNKLSPVTISQRQPLSINPAVFSKISTKFNQIGLVSFCPGEILRQGFFLITSLLALSKIEIRDYQEITFVTLRPQKKNVTE